MFRALLNQSLLVVERKDTKGKMKYANNLTVFPLLEKINDKLTT